MPKKTKSIDGFSAPPKKRKAQTQQRRAEKITRAGGGLVMNSSSVAARPKAKAKPHKTRKEVSSDFLAPVETLNFDFDERDFEKELRLEKKNKKKKKSKVKRFILITIILIILGAAAFLWLWANGIIGKITGGNVNLFDFFVAKDVDLKTGKNGRTNILMFGTSGYDMAGNEGKGKHDGAQLTDSIMVASFDQKTKDLAMVSLPRDLYVKRTCTAAAKVNEVYWCANQKGTDEEAGVKALEKSVDEILGVDIQYYVHVNWGSLVNIVNSIGGITVTLDESIKDSWTKTYIKAGEAVTLNGEQALGLARARHGTAGGDFTRGASQQKILIAIKEKISEKGLGITEAMSLLDTLGDNLRMNFNADEIKTVVNISKEVDLKNMRQVPLTEVGEDKKNYVTTSSINDISYVVPSAGVGNYKEIHEYIAKEFSSDSAARENAKILVLNGSEQPGMAAKERKKLRAIGFTDVDIDDAPDGKYKNSYYVYAITDEMKATKKSLKKRYKVKKVEGSEALPQGVNAKGYDFVVIIGRPEED